jgi:ABC-type cobalamin transport system ATPase subunit
LLLRNGAALAAGKMADVLKPAALSKLFDRKVRLIKGRAGWSLDVAGK